MLTMGEFNLSSFPEYTNSFGEVLKQTMIGQETIFRNQVYELHHLYQRQKNLTGKSGFKEFDATYNSWKERLQSPAQPFLNSRHYAALGERNLFRNIAVASTEFLKQDQFSDYNISSRNEVDLTLRIGEDTRKKGMANKEDGYEKSSHFFARSVIDLEASTDTVSQEDMNNAFGLSYATPVTGCNEPNSGISSNATSLESKLFASIESIKIDFDLNKVQFDNSFDLNDPADTCLLTSPIDKLKGIYSEEASCSYAASIEKVNGNGLNESSITPPSKNSSKENLVEICDVEITEMLEENVSLVQPCISKARLQESNSNVIRCTTGSVEQMKDELVEGNDLVQEAAELLLHFSLRSSVGNRDYSTNAGSNLIKNEESDRPQCSMDSYESLVLKLEETSVEDYCVSSKAFEVEEFDKKESGVMWRRGRRLKDFQKEILPNLVSLSRHEIREDVGVMEAVMRSREYKRRRSKAANEENWFTPTKCKRSRPRRRCP